MSEADRQPDKLLGDVHHARADGRLYHRSIKERWPTKATVKKELADGHELLTIVAKNRMLTIDKDNRPTVASKFYTKLFERMTRIAMDAEKINLGAEAVDLQRNKLGIDEAVRDARVQALNECKRIIHNALSKTDVERRLAETLCSAIDQGLGVPGISVSILPDSSGSIVELEHEHEGGQ